MLFITAILSLFCFLFNLVNIQNNPGPSIVTGVYGFVILGVTCDASLPNYKKIQNHVLCSVCCLVSLQISLFVVVNNACLFMYEESSTTKQKSVLSKIDYQKYDRKHLYFKKLNFSDRVNRLVIKMLEPRPSS